ncbi:MAG: hypothetical protein EBT50_09085 [Verrucomicrobia bacterium]|nr:hypothetical protein [Verrucomicrobiota bacterium]
MGRENAAGSDQTGNLKVEGKEGEEVGQAGQPGQEPEAEGVVQEDLILTILLSWESRMIFMPGSGVGLTPLKGSRVPPTPKNKKSQKRPHPFSKTEV